MNTKSIFSYFSFLLILSVFGANLEASGFVVDVESEDSLEALRNNSKPDGVEVVVEGEKSSEEGEGSLEGHRRSPELNKLRNVLKAKDNLEMPRKSSEIVGFEIEIEGDNYNPFESDSEKKVKKVKKVKRLQKLQEFKLPDVKLDDGQYAYNKTTGEFSEFKPQDDDEDEAQDDSYEAQDDLYEDEILVDVIWKKDGTIETLKTAASVSPGDFEKIKGFESLELSCPQLKIKKWLSYKDTMECAVTYIYYGGNMSNLKEKVQGNLKENIPCGCGKHEGQPNGGKNANKYSLRKYFLSPQALKVASSITLSGVQELFATSAGGVVVLEKGIAYRIPTPHDEEDSKK